MATTAATVKPPPPPPNISDETLRSVAAYFGIEETLDFNGSRGWTIRVEELSTTTTMHRDATFQPQTGSWLLSEKHTATDMLTGPPKSLPDSTSVSMVGSDDFRYDVSQDTGGLHGDDWVDALPNTSHVDFFRSIKWQNSRLGPLGTWPNALRLYTHMVLTQRAASALYWGPHHIAIYNEDFIPLIGASHPKFMGKAFHDIWPEIKNSFEPIFTQIETTGTGIHIQDYNLFMLRHGYLEETWWQGNLFPLPADDGSVGGCCFNWIEATRQVLTDRRTRLLNSLGHFDMSKDSVWTHTRNVLREHSRDIAMAIIYSVEEVDQGQYHTLNLEGSIGLATDDRAAPPTLNLNESEKGFAPALRRARDSPEDWVALERDTANFPKEVLDGVDWQGFEEPSNDIVIIPLRVVNNLLKGFLILGLNPRRAFDADHRQFVTDLRRQLVSVMTSVTTAEQARKREEHLTRDLAETERRIRNIAENVPMGLYDLTENSEIIWANNYYFTIMGCDIPKSLADFKWEDYVLEEDHESVLENLGNSSKKNATVESMVRLKRKWKPPKSPDGTESAEEHAWVMYQAFPHEDGSGSGCIIGCVTDVSSFKWAESLQIRTAEEAQRARQRQEEFIDVVSHELRNPLSAVTQCADGILHSLEEFQRAEGGGDIDAVLQSNQENADSILLCAAHQRRIVDDVLTLSKLDSALVTVMPTTFVADSIKNEVMQMFQAEFTSNDIITETIAEGDVSKVSEDIICDPARLMQVLVNLLTNAIKFTRTEIDRKIKIRYGVTSAPPQTSQFGPNFRWSKTSKTEWKDLTVSAEYGQGDLVYLYFAVEDTGQGLPSNEAVHIFDKFIQASRRTHIKYGGSGLGLYISRELTEMQGGQIGVGSEVGVGSIFAFYVKGRRAEDKRSLISVKDHRPSTDGKKSAMAALADGPTYQMLLVEDNLVNQKVLAKQLRKIKNTVQVANHGGEAVDTLLRAQGQAPEFNTKETAQGSVNFDCVLMDWEMPVLDGLAATKRIRELEDQGKIRKRQVIIGVTANARSEQISEALSCGMDAVVTKPFRVPELMATVSRLLDQKG